MRVLTIDSPPTRAGLWKMLAEAFGKFTGGILAADLAATPRFKEYQIRFDYFGHNHTGTTSGGGELLNATSIRKKHLNLSLLPVLWGNYYYGAIQGTNVFAILAGKGTCSLGTSETAGSTTVHTFHRGSVAIDYNPFDTTWPTTAACQLGIRGLSGYYSTTPFNTNWTVVGAVASPEKVLATDHIFNQVKQVAFTVNATGAYLAFVAETATAESVAFDYKVVLQRL